MTNIKETLSNFENGDLDKPTFIRVMYETHHSVLFDFAEYLSLTNIKKIQIEDEKVIMTSRDRGVRIACSKGDFRIAPIEILNFFDYERSESQMMENLIGNEDNFFDIGSNIGWYSINIAVSRRNAKVFAFEPIPQTYQELKKNVDLNGVRNVIAHNFGFSSESGEFPFYYYPEGSSNASAVNLTDRSDVKSVSCKLQTLDSYIEKTGLRVDFIKCDVEGAELFVFKGGLDTLSRDKPIVFSEILRKWSAKFNYDPNEIFKLFYEIGYRAFVVKGAVLSEFHLMDNLTTETNFFFLHAVKHRNLITKYFL